MTIFITISRGIIARNLLHNRFYDLIKQNFTKVVLLTVASDQERFKKEFSAPNVEIIPIPIERDSVWDPLLSHLYKYLIFNRSTVGHGLYWYFKVPSLLKWIFKFIRFIFISIIFYPLSKVSLVRRTVQWLDGKFLQKKTVIEYKKLLDIYKPNLVFATNMLDEAALLKASREKGIKTISMPKTWDNTSKRYFRGRADKIVAWSPFMKDQYVRLHDYNKNRVTVIGVPQFDYYVDQSRYESREEFCKRVGLDPNKKIICLGSEGKIMPSDTDIAQVVLDLINNGKLPHNSQLFIRPHFGHTNDAQKFVAFKNLPNVVIDSFNNPSGGFNDSWDYSLSQMNHFLSILRHCDVLLNSASTLSLDAAAVGAPTILIKFDGYKKMPKRASGTRWYVCDYLDELMSFNPALSAYSVESLRKSINTLLDNPKLLEQNQKELHKRLCPYMDGKAGERLFQTIYKYVTK